MCYGRNAQATLSWHKVLLPLILLWATKAVVVVNALALKGCDDQCGNVNIPYPFGTREGCYMNETFLITCNRTYNPPLAFMGEGNINVTEIWLSGELRIYAYVAEDCYSQTGRNTYYDSGLTLHNFPISNTRNKFTAIGCDTNALISGSSGINYTTGCISLCADKKDVVEGSCSGIGCCQTAIPKGVVDFNISVLSYNNHTTVWDFNPCSYAFVVEEGGYNFSVRDLRDFRNRTIETPMVLNWAIGDQNCSEAKKDLQNYACTSKDNRTVCLDSNNGKGYYCSCSKGFEGNPYLPDGCQDIDECQNATLSLCAQKCTNYNGTYECSCEPGYEGDAKSDGTGCRRKPSTLIVRVALGEKH
uniref:EGF-like domain-containing protein n=1 Tax=Fagus sylvatica TaxID=28930 RepID=A0A2N9J5D2_FAGSY